MLSSSYVNNSNFFYSEKLDYRSFAATVFIKSVPVIIYVILLHFIKSKPAFRLALLFIQFPYQKREIHSWVPAAF
jgi:hypothetical protein